MLSYSLVLMAIAAIFFYKAAATEKESRLIWAGLSVVVSVLIHLLGGGFVILLLGQIGLFIGITVFRTINDKSEGD